MGTTISILLGIVFSSVIIILYLTTLRSGAQSITADRNTRRSNGTDKRKGVRQ